MNRFLFLLLLTTLGLGSCKKYLDVNNNPNAPTNGASLLIFTNAEAQTAATINGGDFFNADYFMCYKSLIYLFYNISRNNYTSNDFTGVWSDSYHNLQDYVTVEASARSSGQPFLVAASMTMEALNYQITRKGFSLNWEKISVPVSIK